MISDFGALPYRVWNNPTPEAMDQLEKEEYEIAKLPMRITSQTTAWDLMTLWNIPEAGKTQFLNNIEQYFSTGFFTTHCQEYSLRRRSGYTSEEAFVFCAFERARRGLEHY